MTEKETKKPFGIQALEAALEKAKNMTPEEYIELLKEAKKIKNGWQFENDEENIPYTVADDMFFNVTPEEYTAMYKDFFKK